MKLPRKLSRRAAAEVARRAQRGENRRQLASEYGISLSYVHTLATGKLPTGNPDGRPHGSGATSVRVAVRTSGDGAGRFVGGARIFIGRALWQVIGMPERVDFDGIPGQRYWIQPGDDYAITGPRFDGQPRFSLSLTDTHAYGVPPGRYAATIEQSNTIVFSTHEQQDDE